MTRAIHKPTATVRTISGRRGDTVHFSQVIKVDGTTFYWADVADCMLIPKGASPWEVRVAVFAQEMKNANAAGTTWTRKS